MSSVKTETQSKTKVFKMSAKINPKDDSKKSAENLEESLVNENETNNNNNNNNEESTLLKPVEFKPKIVWFNAIGFLIAHIAASYGILLMIFKAKLLTTVWCKF